LRLRKQLQQLLQAEVLQTALLQGEVLQAALPPPQESLLPASLLPGRSGLRWLRLRLVSTSVMLLAGRTLHCGGKSACENKKPLVNDQGLFSWQQTSRSAGSMA
jgi:hypothetical protein